jgi:hypothetical protein
MKHNLNASILLLSILAAFLLSGCALPVFIYANAKEKSALAASGPRTDYVIEPAPKQWPKRAKRLRRRATKQINGSLPPCIQITLDASSDSPRRAVFDSTRFGSTATRSVAIRFEERKEISKAGRAVQNHSRVSARAEAR